MLNSRSIVILLSFALCLCRGVTSHAADAGANTSEKAAKAFVAFKPDGEFAPPPIVVQHDPASGTGYDFATLDKLPLYQMLGAKPEVVLPVRHLRRALEE